MKLFPHNQEAYEKVMAHFETHQRAAVVHATGTGKSYIIGAVSQHFSRVLIVAPNNFVLNETRKVCHEGCSFRTYASVMHGEGDTNAYDLIVLDEFHRSGAEKWCEGVSRLIASNAGAKIFGTSATHIRYLDGQRNMADEMFYGQVVSYLPLKEAIERNILPTPVYVSSIYTMDDTVKSYSKRIKSCKKRLDKEELTRKLKGIASNWDNAGGVPAIIRKYFSKDMNRIIVFCSNVKRSSEARSMLSRWFGLAGFDRVRYYNIDYKEKRLDKEMEGFQAPMGDYDLKVAITVNMLNEGVHIPRVDGIIMLRSTVSRIIAEQQVGRCLTSDNQGRIPVVLDLVNNMDSIVVDEFNFNEESTRENACGENARGRRNEKDFSFKIIDECRDLRKILSRLDEEISNHEPGYWTFDRCLEEALKYNERTKFAVGSHYAYIYSIRNGWLNDVCAHMISKRHPVTFERCQEVALRYKTKLDFIANDIYIYKACAKRGWLDAVCKHMTGNRHHWTIDEIKTEALKYRSKAEFRDKSYIIYQAAKRKGIIDQICSHMVMDCLPDGYWTKDRIFAEAKKYRTLKDFREGSGSAYNKAIKLQILEEVTVNLKRQRRRKTTHAKTK